MADGVQEPDGSVKGSGVKVSPDLDPCNFVADPFLSVPPEAVEAGIAAVGAMRSGWQHAGPPHGDGKWETHGDHATVSYPRGWDSTCPACRRDWPAVVRAVLEAAAPLIAAQAVGDVAQDLKTASWWKVHALRAAAEMEEARDAALARAEAAEARLSALEVRIEYGVEQDMPHGGRNIRYPINSDGADGMTWSLVRRIVDEGIGNPRLMRREASVSRSPWEHDPAREKEIRRG